MATAQKTTSAACETPAPEIQGKCGYFVFSSVKVIQQFVTGSH
jgi:hypothetical protein